MCISDERALLGRVGLTDLSSRRMRTPHGFFSFDTLHVSTHLWSRAETANRECSFCHLCVCVLQPIFRSANANVGYSPGSP